MRMPVIFIGGEGEHRHAGYHAERSHDEIRHRFRLRDYLRHTQIMMVTNGKLAGHDQG